MRTAFASNTASTRERDGACREPAGRAPCPAHVGLPARSAVTWLPPAGPPLLIDFRLPPVAPGQALWIDIVGVPPSSLRRLELRVGGELRCDLPGDTPGVRPLAAGEMLEAIAAYAGRRGLALELAPRAGDDHRPAQLRLWIDPPSPVRASLRFDLG